MLFKSQSSGLTHGLVRDPKATHANIPSNAKKHDPIILLYRNMFLIYFWGLTGYIIPATEWWYIKAKVVFPKTSAKKFIWFLKSKSGAGWAPASMM